MFELLKASAIKLGGEVVSKTYRGMHSRMRFRCKENHVWWTYPYNVRAGHWCPKCGKKKLGDELKIPMNNVSAFAESRGGKCLSEAKDYTNLGSKLKWQCSKGHTFRGCLHNIRRRKYWCPKCRGVLISKR